MKLVSVPRSLLVAATGLGLFLGAAPLLFAVDFPAPSPASTLKQRLGLTDIEINYSRPGVKGRQIFGSLLPWNKVWRTGANAATTISFSTPVKFGGKDVPAGTYALFTIPNPDEWTVILSKNTNQWGAFQYTPDEDLVRVTAKPVTLVHPVETLTLSINDLRDETATLALDWETTHIQVPLEVDYAQQLVAAIEKTMSGPDPKKPYHQAAQFFFDHDQDLKQARAWIDAAVAEDPTAYWSFYLKARILARLGDKAGALAAAHHSIELATQRGDTSYIKSNNDLLASLE